GRYSDGLVRKQLGQPLAAPAGDVRGKFLRVRQVDAGLRQDPPAARPTAAAIEGAVEIAVHAAFEARVRRAGARECVERALDDPPAPRGRKLLQIGPRGGMDELLRDGHRQLLRRWYQP